MLRREGETLATLDPAGMQDYLLNHPLSRGGRLWCDRILEGVDKGERHCLRAYGEAMKWLGAETKVALLLLERIGARDETELKALVASGRKLHQIADVSPEALFEDWLECGRMLLQEHPDWQGVARARLGFESHAKEVA